eukprot:71640_1
MQLFEMLPFVVMCLIAFASASAKDLIDLASGLESASDLVTLIGVAETAERYPDMFLLIEQLVTLKTRKGEDLTQPERDLLSVAFERVIKPMRASRRTLNIGLNADDALGNAYKATVEDELEKICLKMIFLLEELSTNVAEYDFDGQIFYLKETGDLYRYLSEFRTQKKYTFAAQRAYQKAFDLAKMNLSATNTTRLDLALNLSVCYYEIQQPKEACALAKEAFEAALPKLNSLRDQDYKDNILYLQLLR